MHAKTGPFVFCGIEVVDDALLKHLSPLGWEHINLTGDYVWHANKRVAAGRFRLLQFRRIQKAQS